MTLPLAHRSTLSALSLALAALAGCAATESHAPGYAAAAAPGVASVAAAAAPSPAATVREVADFSSGLRCMDELLLDYGTRELPVVVDDVSEQGRRLDDGSKDALIAAVSAMSQRSRLIRVVGDRSANAASSSRALPAEFALRGSFSQVDARTVGADFRMLAAQDLTVVPGAVSRHQASLGAGSAAQIDVFGHRFRVTSSAHRALAELGAIEVVGRMAKLPYWSCLGASDDDAEVAAEVRDWYDAMAARPQEIIEYFQRQLQARRLYDGPVDGQVSASFKEGVARYREVLGLSREPKLTKELLAAHLRTPRRDVLAKLAPAPAAPQAAAPAAAAAVAAPAPAAVAAIAAPAPAPVAIAAAPAPASPRATTQPAAPLRLQVAANTTQFHRGQSLQLWVKPTREANVYCFLQDENKKIMRFFPNRFQRGSRVDAGGVRLPGAMRFEIQLNARGATETVSCFATDRDVLAELPAAVSAPDFTPLAVASLDQVREAFTRVSAGTLAHDTLQAQPR